MRVSPHTAQASEKPPLWGFPQLLHCFTLLPDCQNSHMACRAHHPKTSFAFSAFIWFNQLSHDQRPAERQPPYGAGNLSPGIPTITAGHSLHSASQSSPPSACLAVSLTTEGDGSGFPRST